MERYIDETILLSLCVAISLATSNEPYLIAGMLIAVIFICVCWIMDSAPSNLPSNIIRKLAEIVFYIASAAFAPCTLFLPVAVYIALHEKEWIFRLLWIVPLVVLFIFAQERLQPTTIVAIVGLCIIGALLAIRDVRTHAEREGLKLAYDSVRENFMMLKNELAQNNDVPKLDIHEEVFIGLSKRELAVAKLVSEGMDNREIANSLYLSEGTVRNHISSILSKLNLSNRTQIAVAYYRGNGS